MENNGSLTKTTKHNFWLKAEDIFNIDPQVKLWSIDWQCANNEDRKLIKQNNTK